MKPRANALKKDIARLENEFGLMQATERDLVIQLETLQSSMHILRSHIDQLRSDCAPVGSLPNEILVAIFEARPSKFEDREGYAMGISQVSRLWRSIALSTPSLWNSIRVDFLFAGEGQLSMLDLFIERSRKSPLDIVISLERDEDDHNWHEFWEQTEKIFPLVSRWRTLLILGQIRNDVFGALHDLDRSKAPMLELFEVRIESPIEAQTAFDEPLLLFQGGAPRLAQIEIHEISIAACQPPLSSITSLRLHHPPHPYNIAQYRGILVAANNLSDLQLFGNIINARELYAVATSRTALIRIPSLRSLVISPSWSTGPFTLYSLLASLDTPALEYLTLHCCPWQNHVSEFQEIFRNYGPPRYPLLRALTLRYADFSQPVAIWFTSMLPSITCISLIECKSSARFFSLLAGNHRFTKVDKWADNDTDSDNDTDDEYARKRNVIEEETALVEDETNSVHLPHLLGICLLSIDITGLLGLCDVISQRASRGIPIAYLQFASTEVSHIPSDKLEWLRERVRVEVCELK